MPIKRFSGNSENMQVTVVKIYIAQGWTDPSYSQRVQSMNIFPTGFLSIIFQKKKAQMTIATANRNFFKKKF